MRKFDIVVSFLSVSAVVSFLSFSAIVYEAREQAKKTEKNLSDSQYYYNSVVDHLATRISHLERDLKKKNQQITLLEESIDPKNFRWAKIKKVRKAVQQTPNAVVRMGGTQKVTTYATAVVDWSEKHDIPASLVLAMTRQESAFNPKATSYTRNGKPLAKGVIQIIDSTAKEIAGELGVRHYNMYKISDNVHFGTYYIMKMLDEFDGDVALAVRAYNAGPTFVKKVLAGEIADYPSETRDYVKRIVGDDETEGYLKFYEDMGL